MRTFFFIPPLAKTSGGLAVLLAMAAQLHAAGFPVWLVPREGSGSFDLAPDVPVLPWDALAPRPSDLWLVPEGWPNALAPGLKAGARCLVYCQNWAYLFGSLPRNVHWNQLKVSFLAVSQPVAWFIEQTLGKRCPILRPGIDLTRFAPAAKPEGEIRVAYMPRKNKALAKQIREIFEARRATFASDGVPVSWIEIAGQDQAGVARLLGDAHIFLVTGFPEGCPLPPLEAMASGCLPVGFTGFGGWDYMRQAWTPEAESPASGFAPWHPLRPAKEIDWAGNGLWTADADVVAAALALDEAVRWHERKDSRLASSLENARRTALHYGRERQRERVLELWTQAQAGELFVPE
jgi:hypothetical protein